MTRGHTLVIPRTHAADLWELPDADATALMLSVRGTAELLRARLPLAGLNVFQANGRAAWQTVFHVHLHLVPRYDAGELNLPWIPTPAPADQLDDVHTDLTSRT